MTAPADHKPHIFHALSLAKNSPPKPTNFRVGALLVDLSTNTILSTGYTLELPGNTHAEQCCLSKYAANKGVALHDVGQALPEEGAVMYVTMEPCGRRLSGKVSCVERIIWTRDAGRRGIVKVYFGVKEPGTFVGESEGCKKLSEVGVEWEHVPGMEEEILAVATAGHGKEEEKQETNVDNIGEEERRRQEQIPRNPKKRMMEVDVPGTGG